MNRNVVISEGEYYHVYNRGVEKREIFLDNSDRERFMKLLYLSNGTKPFNYRDVKFKPLLEIERGRPYVAIGAYVLMPNHFHILLKGQDKSGVADFMEKLTTGYSKYFNTKQVRVGHLFQGRYKAEHIDSDEYLKYLYSYIHLNPVKLIEPTWKEKGICNLPKAKKYLESYRYSSYQDYAVEKREESAILTPKEFPGYFDKKKDFVKFVDEWLDYGDEWGMQETENLRKEGVFSK